MSPRHQQFRCPSAARNYPAWLGAVAALIFAAGRAVANPAGMTVAGGTASASASGNNLDITASHNAVINWASFNIGAGETTTFHQPSAVSVVWNRIADANPSQIWGGLNANGIVVLMNQSGFYFGPNSSINVGGFIATTAPFNPPSASGAPVWERPSVPPLASIINYGQIKASDGGSLFLVAEKIENHGILSAPDGTLGLYAGKEVLISERPDGRGLSASVALPDGSVDNNGKLIANAGNIAVHARVVNQDGVIQANSIRNNHGVIELVASDSVNLGANSLIRASGDDSGTSDGGKITVQSAGAISDTAGSRIEIRGGANGGNGGSAEISAPSLVDTQSQIDGTAAGFTGGSLLIDPYDFTLTTANIASYAGLSQILVQATHDIFLADNTVWRLNPIGSTTGNMLTLEAGQDINFGDGSKIQAGAGWSVSLSAGVDFSSPTLAVTPGVGGIYLNYGAQDQDGAIQTDDGDITLNAGHEVIVGNGYIRTGYVGTLVDKTKSGGNISITTGDGGVNSGTQITPNDGFDPFTSDGYTVSSALGGIATAHGGNVTINAGQDIIANNAPIGAFGAGGRDPITGNLFGTTPGGNVTLTAGRDVLGSFMIVNGTGTINAGRDVGNGSSGVSLGLVAGGWNVTATRDLYLDEIFNPNGSLNPNNADFGAGVPFQFDYAPNAFASLAAGNSVQLLGDSLANTLPNALPIYAPILNISAGAGGVTLGNDVVLYPSPQGYLSIVTTAGGSLVSSPGNYFQLVASDSGDPDYNSFISGHAATPLHLGQPGDVMDMDIAGDLQNIAISSPGQASIHVHGDVTSMAFNGQNLSASDVTTLTIDGNYSSRSQIDSTTVTLSDDAAAAFERIFGDPYQVLDSALAAKLSYNSTTHQLSIQGTMTVADLNFLLNPTRYEWNAATGYTLDQNGNFAIVSDVLTTDTADLNKLYADVLQSIPTSPLAGNGLQIGGPGLFKVGAANMDLGISSGIRSVGTLLNPSLATVSVQGADLDLNLGGDLDMTSSQIASFNGGSITINAGGEINVGSQNSLTSDSTPKGIYTGHGGAVFVEAVGDINVNGSRIASYDGGDVAVISDNGSVDAGAGAKGFFYVTTSAVNPDTGQVEARNDRFFGSGIVALTRSDDNVRVGDITIQAAGNISAGSGGVLQLAFNDYDQNGAKVTVLSDAGSIFAGQSGMLGQNLDVKAPKGSIEGIFVAGQNADIHAQNNVNVTAIAGGSASVSGGGTVSGSVVGGTGVNVSGADVNASVISTGGSASANGSDAKGSAFAGVAAPTTQKTTDDADKTVANKSLAQNDDEDEKKKKRGVKPAIARRVSRVTVILPNQK